MITPIFWSNYGSDLLGDLQGAENTMRSCLTLHISAHLGKKIYSVFALNCAVADAQHWLLDK